ncbi:hypothetical protein NPIL_524681 [Nephila pilipes]|uniref:Uncharacterized protein n=1 Tax=Nephila pilipes TaxID=299642 RepID=A0A8X6NE84_NEPPI|nr:hypothetical protein NPIL_524681 [Nephila pilipes]
MPQHQGYIFLGGLLDDLDPQNNAGSEILVRLGRWRCMVFLSILVGIYHFTHCSRMVDYTNAERVDTSLKYELSMPEESLS